jgi:O-antigen/teichoic acid export membrane protein
MFIIAAMLTPADLGLYSISVLIAETIWYLPNSIGQVLFAKTASEKKEDADYFTPLVCRSVIFVTFFACTVLFLISDFIIPLLFTSMFLSSVMALKLLLPGIFFFSISKILAQDLVGRGFPQYASVAATIALVAIIIFDLLLIPRLGINGASLASTISYFLSAITILYLFKKKSQVKLWDILIIKPNDLTEYHRIISYFIAMLKAKKFT